MTNRADLEALAVRAEQATGADAYLDLDMHAAAGGEGQTPKYTASLDAALTLVPEGWQWEVKATGEALVYDDHRKTAAAIWNLPETPPSAPAPCCPMDRSKDDG